MMCHRRSVTGAAAVLVISIALSVAAVPAPTSNPVTLTVHEWGTFTSIAGPDGTAVEWRALGGASDLPCFVERSPFNVKGALFGTVRMETPVLYFYAPTETTVGIRVRFRSGVITEWFPHAAVGPQDGISTDGAIAWKRVKVSPGGPEDFPVEQTWSHYYTARQTSAAPVQSGSQRDKFLFYRGVGRFALPIAATLDAAGNVTIQNCGPDRIEDLIVFSNYHGRLQYLLRRNSDDQPTFDRVFTDREPVYELEQLLVANNLYPDEASAMVETWRDSWFEEGTRLFYVVPRRLVDRVLPLDINPPATDVARAFVARTELFTPAAREEISGALATNDIETLRAYGRFLEAYGSRIVAGVPASNRRLLEERLRSVLQSMVTPDRCAIDRNTH